MRSYKEIRKARNVLIEWLAHDGLNNMQRANLSGMSVALQWVCQDGGSALDMLVEGMSVEIQEES